jgi:hypothetical protein
MCTVPRESTISIKPTDKNEFKFKIYSMCALGVIATHKLRSCRQLHYLAVECAMITFHHVAKQVPNGWMRTHNQIYIARLCERHAFRHGS